MIKGVKHIIFDLGGVLLNIDYGLTEKAFTDAGITNFKEMYSQLAQTPLFDELETGKTDSTEFIKAIQAIAGASLTEGQIIKAWNAMLLDFPVRRLQLLQQLRMYHDLVLLSNTNEIHEAEFNNILMRSHGIPTIGVFFDKVYFSHRVGLRKPGREIFERILEENGFKPEHTLFIDDSPQHIATAAVLGIPTIYLEKGLTIGEHVFKPMGM
ncbi:MAG: HAD family phosphatase [Taibaiella sp.]|nr:HAD family phosphatase [Taibaiella sp.]